MRLDLFLKTGRILKRRTVAQTLCEEGRVLVNGRKAKPSRNVKPGDIITMKSPFRIIQLEVIGDPTGPLKKGEPPETLYQIISETRLSREREQ